MNIWNYLQYNLRYYQKPPWDTGISPPELIDFIHKHPTGRALDLGCGTGTNAITLAKHGWRVTGIDFAWRAVRAAQRKAKQAGLPQVCFHMGDVTRLKGISGPFDLILDIGCFHSLSQKDKQNYSRNLERLLAPGGSFLLYGFLKEPGEERPGITEADIKVFSSALELIWHQEGSDRASGGKSAWFDFQKPAIA